MGNSFFKYKQFTVNQGDCAMKVCTDTSLFGALIDPNNPTSILDIGTGTGVLTLMIAQITEAKITAIEIDDKAAKQAANNFKDSKWQERISIINDDVKTFSKSVNTKYDLIISNPPFFQGNMLSDISEKNKARHNTSLTLEELAISTNDLLTINGQFWVLLPQYEASLLEKSLANFGLKISKQINIKNYIDDEKISRTVNCFEREVSLRADNEMAIYKDKNREYTVEFSQLLKPYYLYL